MGRLSHLPLIVLFMGIGAVAMLLPAAHALAQGEERISRTFFYGAIGFTMVAAMIGISTSGHRIANPARSQLASLAGAYLVLPIMLAIPFHQAIRDTTFFNAWFEMVSCLTTTGATVYDSPGRLDPSLHLWRVLVGWLGGLLVLVGAAAILAPMDLGGAEVISGRVPGRGQGGALRGDPGTRLVRHAFTLLPAYVGLTLMLWIALRVSGMEAFLAFCLALSTLSSSGITPGTGLPGAGGGIMAEALIFAFLAIGLSRRFLPGAVLVDRTRPLMRDHEIQTAFAVLVTVPAILFAVHWLSDAPEVAQTPTAMLRALWGAVFMTMSFLTTAGLESAEWAGTRVWVGLGNPGLVLVGLAILGGGIATTTGGLKLLRVFALFSHSRGELQRIIHPSAVHGGGAADRRLREDGAFAAWVFFMLYGLTLAVTMGLLTMTGLAFDNALVLAVASISTTGPLATLAAEVPLRYADLTVTVKSVLAAAMVLGRMEVLAILALLAPSAWRR
jgi:trk system potassium uptake protein TrkH